MAPQPPWYEQLGAHIQKHPLEYGAGPLGVGLGVGALGSASGPNEEEEEK